MWKRFARNVVVLGIAALGIACATTGCGKQGGLPGSPPKPGVYHLTSSREPTSIVLHDDGTFTLLRETCESMGDLECGHWYAGGEKGGGAGASPADGAGASGPAHVKARDDMYWPTPESFPSAVLTNVTLRADRDGGMMAIGESAWAGRFTQQWSPGRRCAACDSAHAGAHATRATVERRCDDPFPSCTIR